MELSLHNFGRIRPVYLLAVCFLCLAGKIYGQSRGVPGSWTKVTVNPVFAVQDMDFVDSLNGVFFNGTFLRTSDGGQSWKLIDSVPIFKYGWIPPCLHAVSCAAPSHAIVMKANCDQLELDGDSIYQADCSEDVPPSFQIYVPFAQKMYDTSYGFRFVQVVTRGSYYPESYIAVTHDGWKTYQAYGDSLNNAQLTSDFDGNHSQIFGAKIVDSNDVWVGVNSTIYHTTNSGATWQTLQPLVGTADSNIVPDWYDFIAYPSTKEVYAKSVVAPIDYAYSSDYGSTWTIDSTFKGHLAYLVSPAPHILWGVLSPISESSSGGTPPFDLLWWESSSNFCTKIAYSSDNGTHWATDSTTFKVDSTILAMYWQDTNHGWISVVDANPIADSSIPRTFIWYYSPNQNESVQNYGYGIKYGQVHLYPNPATNVIFTEETLDGAMQIYDPLGRRYLVPQTTSSFDISNLPNGVYFLYDGVAVRGKFLKQ